MKNLTRILFLIGLGTFAFSDETMCFKKSHTNLETIETVKLDGGLCSGKNSKVDMQNKGWYVKNINIKDDYYIYIFKKERKTISKIDDNSKETIKSEIISELKMKKEEEITEIKKQINLKEYTKGEKIYLKKCSSCHGMKGEVKIVNTEALQNISLDRFKHAISGYRIGSYNLGNSSEMRPYSMIITTSEIKAIYKYLQKIK